MDFSYQDEPERNNALHYFNVYWANKYVLVCVCVCFFFPLRVS